MALIVIGRSPDNHSTVSNAVVFHWSNKRRVNFDSRAIIYATFAPKRFAKLWAKTYKTEFPI
jgi:hypothetical protein